MKVYFNATCPYCGHDNKYCAEITDQYTTRPLVYACDEEEGGCGRYFAVRLSLEINVSVLTILEEQPRQVLASQD